MTSTEAITRANQILPGHAAPDDEEDPRWQAIIAVAEFIESDPEAVWSFTERWGQHQDEDLRQGIATCLLEHLLEHQFDLVFPRVERLARSNQFFADTVTMCWKFGEAAEVNKARKLEQLVNELNSAS